MNYIKRKESIILTAIEIIDRLGFQGLSIKEIAKRQDISEGTLYKHYKSKDDLMLAVLEYYTMFDDEIFQTIKLKNYTTRESITYYVTRFAEYYQSYPELTALLNLNEFLRNEAGISHKVIQIFEERSAFIAFLIDKGIDKGEVCSDTNAESLTAIILGSFRFITLKWRIQNYSFPLKQIILKTNNEILDHFHVK